LLAKVDICIGDGWKLNQSEILNAIHVGAAATDIPQCLIKALKKGGRLIIPVGPQNGEQDFMQIDKLIDGTIVQKSLFKVRYGPLIKSGIEKTVLSMSMIDKFNAMNVSPQNVKQISYSEIKKLKLLGKGAFGEVSLAEWNSVYVAVKESYIYSLQAKEALKKEIEILAALNHPCIVRFYGISVESNNVSIVMEYCQKGCLFDLWIAKKENLSWKTRINISCDIANAISFLHNEKVVHRDIKSGNVLLDGNLSAKLADFGISQMRNLCNVTYVGTPCYMAPEFQNGKGASFGSDIFSFGIILWELSTRYSPEGVQNFQFIFGDDSPPKFKALGGKCISLQKENRPTAKACLEVLKSLK